MSRLFWLSLLAVISCDKPPPCDVSAKLTVAESTDGSSKIVYPKEDNSFGCEGNDTIIYERDKGNGYNVEYTSIKCNETTLQWEAVEKYKALEYRNIIKKPGTVKCMRAETMSCADTRLRFSNLSLWNDAKDPTFEVHSRVYTCPTDLNFLYTAKFALRKNEGLYLLGPPVCKDRVLTAPFAARREPVNISHVGSIICKKFSCLDSNDAPISWPLILKMDFECFSSWTDCQTPDWFDKSPCGEGGHELMVHRNDGSEFWLKDHFFECNDKGRIYYVDTAGQKKPKMPKDKIVCRLPPPCTPLMSDPAGKYGCHQRSSCESINASLIPRSHLSSFDGRCFSIEYALKIVTTETIEAPGTELAFVTCQYGIWRATKAVREFNSDGKMGINEKTNLVCEARDAFDSCPLPLPNCEGDVSNSRSMCESVVLDQIGAKLSCRADSKKHLVLRKLYDNKTEEIERINDPMVCDRSTGRWIGTRFPYVEEKSGDDWTSHIVCAAESNERHLLSKCTDKNKNNCRTVAAPKYWMYAKCPDNFYLAYSRNQEKMPVRIHRLHAENSSSEATREWKFFEKGVHKTADATDSFFCESNPKPTKASTHIRVIQQTSTECQPTNLDSICHFEKDICLTVKKKPNRATNTSVWECDVGRSLWYYDTGSKGYREELMSLKCEKIFWKAQKKDGMIFIPAPHSNFVCLFPATKKETDKKSETDGPEWNRDENKKEKPWEWPIPPTETAILFSSFAVVLFSTGLVVWANREFARAQKSKTLK